MSRGSGSFLMIATMHHAMQQCNAGHVAVLDYPLLGLVTMEERFFPRQKRAAQKRKPIQQNPQRRKDSNSGLDMEALIALWETGDKIASH